jgi:uncharacterized Tic20 family protein
MEITRPDRTWAVLAHASTLLTLLASIVSGGIGGIIFVVIPLAIYLSFKDHSRFVAYHAAQALIMQLAATVGWLAAVLIGSLALVLLWAVTGLLCIILVGILLIPIMVLVTVLYVLAILLAPLIFGGYAIVGMAEAGNGQDYSYPWIGDYVRGWLEQQAQPVTAA